MANSNQTDGSERDPSKDLTEILVRVLDDAIRIPGTRARVGLDALLGLVLPALGDLTTGVASLALLMVAWRRRVPAVTMGRMVVNILIDTLVGLLPVAGDLFDFLWRANRRNLDLIERHERSPDTRPSTGDYLMVTAAFGVAVTAMVLPIVLVLLYGSLLVRMLGG